jgi:predicted nucleic acid-binding protein
MALDTNVLSALWSGEPTSRGIESVLFRARSEGGLVICAPVYCELLAHPSATLQFVQEFLGETAIFWTSSSMRRCGKRRRMRSLPTPNAVAAHEAVRPSERWSISWWLLTPSYAPTG